MRNNDFATTGFLALTAASFILLCSSLLAIAFTLTATLDLDLGAELDDLSGRHTKESGRALGVTRQERKQRPPPHPHSRNVLSGNDGFASDVVSDIFEIDAGQLALQ